MLAVAWRPVEIVAAFDSALALVAGIFAAVLAPPIRCCPALGSVGFAFAEASSGSLDRSGFAV